VIIKPVLLGTERRGSGNSEELIETGKITTVIDRTYSLSETPEAIRYLEEVHTRGRPSSRRRRRERDAAR
jgi:hypothetical protein